MPARYVEIADDLRRRIRTGDLPLGTPSIAALMEHYGVPGLNTIRQAQAVLIQEGLLEAHQGVGVFVVAKAPAEDEVDVLAELQVLRASLDRLIARVRRRGATGR